MNTVAAAMVDMAGEVIRSNELFRSLVGDTVGHETVNLSRWIAGERTWEFVSDRCRGGSPVRTCLDVEQADGRTVRLVGEFVPGGAGGEAECMIALFRRDTEPESIRATMSRNARLEALVCLTSGVAHDFNNLLTVLSGNLGLAAEEVRTRQPETFRKLKAARDAANRGGDLIRQLLAFARQKELGPESIEPVRVVNSVAPLIERALGSKVGLVLDLDESAGSIEASAAQLESAIVNLAVNARDAMQDGGQVRISVRSVSIGNGRGDPGHVEVEVADSGSGIPAGLIEKVREPFFTTKGDSGTGLGLSMVDAFVRQYQGTLSIESESGRGTRIRMRFPRHEPDTAESIEATMPLLALPGGDETIVVVGRDESVLGTVDQILSVLGYQIVTATNMQEANRAIRSRVPRLIVTDGFDTGALLNACRSVEGGARCAALELVAQADLAAKPSWPDSETPVTRIAKPFSLPDLAKGIRNALDRPRAG